MRFSEWLRKFEEQNVPGFHLDGASGWNTPQGAYLSSDQTGSEPSTTPGFDGHALHLPSTDFAPHIPDKFTSKKTGRILRIEYKRDPIRIYLAMPNGGSDMLLFTLDEFRRIKGKKPTQGRHLTYTLMQPPNLKLSGAKIMKILCH